MDTIHLTWRDVEELAEKLLARTPLSVFRVWGEPPGGMIAARELVAAASRSDRALRLIDEMPVAPAGDLLIVDAVAAGGHTLQGWRARGFAVDCLARRGTGGSQALPRVPDYRGWVNMPWEPTDATHAAYRGLLGRAGPGRAALAARAAERWGRLLGPAEPLDALKPRSGATQGLVVVRGRFLGLSARDAGLVVGRFAVGYVGNAELDPNDIHRLVRRRALGCPALSEMAVTLGGVIQRSATATGVGIVLSAIEFEPGRTIDDGPLELPQRASWFVGSLKESGDRREFLLAARM